MAVRLANHTVELKEINKLFEAGRGIAAAECSGVMIDLPRRQVSFDKEVIVDQGYFATVSARDGETPRILTLALMTCVAVISYNPDTQAAFLAHVDTLGRTVSAMEEATEGIRAKQIALFGGFPSDFRKVAVMEGYLVKYCPKIEVVGRDLLRGAVRSMNIGIDAQAGEIFEPVFRYEEKPVEYNQLHRPLQQSHFNKQ